MTVVLVNEKGNVPGAGGRPAVAETGSRRVFIAHMNHLERVRTHVAESFGHQAAVTTAGIIHVAAETDTLSVGPIEDLTQSLVTLVQEQCEHPREGAEVQPVAQGIPIGAGVTQGSHVHILDADVREGRLHVASADAAENAVRRGCFLRPTMRRSKRRPCLSWMSDASRSRACCRASA